jgi:hypothetical protein
MRWMRMEVVRLNSMSSYRLLRVLPKENTRELPIEPQLIKKFTNLKINQ